MRSKLFVPASRPALFPKAMGGEADAISFDLEDAVAPEAKPEARAALRAFLEPRAAAAPGPGAKMLIVRVNAVETAHFQADLEAVVWPALHVVNLPMVESPQAVAAAADAIEALERQRGVGTPIGILANIESPRGLRVAAAIACAHPRVMGLQIGYGDLFAPLGIASAEPSATQFVRTAVRLAAGEAGIEAYDGAYVDIGNPEGFRADSAAARQLGFGGRSCIHPSQVAAANDVFRPSEEAVRHAVRVVEAARLHLAQGTGAFTVDGRLVDGPFITSAERLVAQAKRLGMI